MAGDGYGGNAVAGGVADWHGGDGAGVGGGGLSEMGAPLMVETLRGLAKGRVGGAGAGSCRGYVGADVEGGRMDGLSGGRGSDGDLQPDEGGLRRGRGRIRNFGGRHGICGGGLWAAWRLGKPGDDFGGEGFG